MSRTQTNFCLSFFFSASSSSASLNPSTTEAMRLCAVSAWPVIWLSEEYLSEQYKECRQSFNIFTNHEIPSGEQFPREHIFVLFRRQLRHSRILGHSEIFKNATINQIAYHTALPKGSNKRHTSSKWPRSYKCTLPHRLKSMLTVNRNNCDLYPSNPSNSCESRKKMFAFYPPWIVWHWKLPVKQRRIFPVAFKI